MSKTKFVRLKLEHVQFLLHERLLHEVIRSFGTNDGSYEDVYHDLLIAISQRVWLRKPTFCRHHKRIVPVDPSHLIQFAKHRVIDIVRARKRRPAPACLDTVSFQPSILPATTMIETVEAYNRIMDVLRTALNDTELSIVLAKAFPPPAVLAMAEKDRADAEEDRSAGYSRMHFRTPVVRDRHVAAYTRTSPATVSRALARAKQAIEGTLT